MPFSSLPEEVTSLVKGLLGIVLAVMAGRLGWHVAEVQRGHRRFWSVALAWEALTVPLLVLIGKGASQVLALAPGGWPELGLVAALAWLGPRGLEALLAAWVHRRRPPDPLA